MQSIVHGLQEQYGERVTFASAEIEDPVTAAWRKQYRVRGTPFIVLLGQDGQMAHRIYGVVEASELQQWLERLLQ